MRRPVTILTLFIALAVPSTAVANSHDGTDYPEADAPGYSCRPTNTSRLLPPREREDIMCSPVVTPTGAGCASRYAGRRRESAAGITVWRYRQEIEWCWNAARTRITSIYRTRWGRTYVPLWHFRGHIGNATSGGEGYSYYRAFTQGKFEWCTWVTGCIYSADPWVTMRTYANGSWSYATG